MLQQIMVNNNRNAKTIRNEIISTNPTTAPNKVKAGEYGAIEVILSAMKAHMSIADVCEQGCWALWNITADNGKQQPQCKDNFE